MNSSSRFDNIGPKVCNRTIQVYKVAQQSRAKLKHNMVESISVPLTSGRLSLLIYQEGYNGQKAIKPGKFSASKNFMLSS